MSYNRTPQEAQAIHENVVTLNVKELVYLMPPFEHQHFMKRAAAGHDVYAYRIETFERIAFNIWDTDTRIPFSDQPITWQIETFERIGHNRYEVVVQNVHTQQLTSVKRFIRGEDTGLSTVDLADMVERHILAFVQHLNVFGGEPISE